MKTAIPTLLAAMLCAAAPLPPIENAELPPPLEEFIAEALPEYAIVALSDYEAIDIQHDGDHLTWNVRGDFDGNGHLDYILLLMDDDGAVSLHAFNASRDGFEHFQLDSNAGRLPVHAIVTVVEAGTTPLGPFGEIEQSQTVLENPAIRFGILETCADVLYYFKDGEYQVVYRM